MHQTALGSQALSGPSEELSASPDPVAAAAAKGRSGKGKEEKGEMGKNVREKEEKGSIKGICLRQLRSHRRPG